MGSGSGTSDSDIDPDSLGHVSANPVQTKKALFFGMFLALLVMCGPQNLLVWVMYGAVGFLGMLYLNQSSMLYAATPPGMPRRCRDNPPRMRSPAEWDIPFENVMVRKWEMLYTHTTMILFMPN